MSEHAIAHPTLIDAAWKSESGSKLLRYTVFAVLGTVALTIAAKIKIPFFPVEMTMQTFVVLAMSMAFGARLAGATVLLYLAEGALGLPVFTGTPEKGIGLAYMAGPTGGYLLGFFLAAITVGYLAERGWDRNFATTAAAMLIGNVIIYVPGLVYLGILLGWDKPILEWGLYPFLYADALKLALATAVMPMAWTLIKKR